MNLINFSAFSPSKKPGLPWAFLLPSNQSLYWSNNQMRHNIYNMTFASVYPYYVAKAERKGRTKSEVDEIIRWLTGYSQVEFEKHLEQKTNFESFFAQAPQLNPARNLIKGVICGTRIEDIEESLMREIRYLDKLIDELAKGKTMGKILRT
jgi:hypothetical protein